MGSCFKKIIVRNMMMQSNFNWDTWFRSYDFFSWKKYGMCWRQPLALVIWFTLPFRTALRASGAMRPTAEVKEARVAGLIRPSTMGEWCHKKGTSCKQYQASSTLWLQCEEPKLSLVCCLKRCSNKIVFVLVQIGRTHGGSAIHVQRLIFFNQSSSDATMWLAPTFSGTTRS